MAVRHRILFSLMGAGAACGAAPALAQSDPAAELDAPVNGAANRQAGMALARQEIRAGKLTIAAATLERVLMASPRADARATRDKVSDPPPPTPR